MTPKRSLRIRQSRARLYVAALSMIAAIGVAASAAAQSLVLYSTDYESPNVPLQINCGNSLDTRGMNFLYGEPGITYSQEFTVEAVVLDDTANLYSDPSGTGGTTAIGMLSTLQNDKMAITFSRQGRSFINVGLHLSAIDVSGCGGPFGVAAPILRVSLLNSAGGAFNFGQPVLDTDTMTGVAPPNQWTFTWTYGVVSLDASGATDDFVSIVFDMQQSGYAAFDNVSIIASNTPGVVDGDVDGVPDDVDNCPTVPNPGQQNADGDAFGDACDACPDGDLDAGEECDDGNPVSTDACTNDCQNAECGDGIVQTGVDECDDGNTLSGDCCSATCNLDPAATPCTDDGDACTADQCDAGGVCTHPTTITTCTNGDGCCAGGCVYATDDDCPVPTSTPTPTTTPTATPTATPTPTTTSTPTVTVTPTLSPTPTPTSTPGFTCCEVHPTPGCLNPDCASMVCVADPYCCDTAWDEICVREGQGFGAYCGICAQPACLDGSTDATACMDRLVCYAIKATKGGARFAPVAQHTLIGVDETRTLDVIKPLSLCGPGHDPSGAIIDAAMHYETYKTKTIGLYAKIADDFGTWTAVGRGNAIMVPTYTMLDGPASAPPAGTADSYVCAKAKFIEKFPKGVQVTLTDEFESDRLYDVKKPKAICRTVHEAGDRYVNPEMLLMCYQIKLAKGQAKHVPVVGRIHTANLFGEEEVNTSKHDSYCVPAKRVP